MCIGIPNPRFPSPTLSRTPPAATTDFFYPPVQQSALDALSRLASASGVAVGGYAGAERRALVVGHPEVVGALGEEGAAAEGIAALQVMVVAIGCKGLLTTISLAYLWTLAMCCHEWGSGGVYVWLLPTCAPAPHHIASLLCRWITVTAPHHFSTPPPSHLTSRPPPPLSPTLQVDGNFLFDPATHRDFLGAILATGIERGCVGDVIVNGEKGCHLLIKREVAMHVTASLTSVRTVPVAVTEVPFSDIIVPETRAREVRSVEASLRVDAVASAGFGVSRGKVRGDEGEGAWQVVIMC